MRRGQAEKFGKERYRGIKYANFAVFIFSDAGGERNEIRFNFKQKASGLRA
jgi:hypothetical protein